MQVILSAAEVEVVLAEYGTATSKVQRFNTVKLLHDGRAELSYDPAREQPEPEPEPKPRLLVMVWRGITLQYPEGGWRRAKPTQDATHAGNVIMPNDGVVFAVNLSAAGGSVAR